MAHRAVRLLAVVLAVSGVARAQQPPVFHDQVVVTATGDEQPVDGVAAACTVISAAEMRALGITSLADALRWVPGVTVLRSGSEGGVTSLFTRGTASTQTLVMWDGVRLNSPFFGGYDWSLPLAVGLGRVEVVRGPYSALYGADAIGGVVQLVPARAAGNAASALIEGGGDGWRRGEVQATAVAGRWETVVAGGGRDGSGPLANDDFSSRAGLVSVTASLDDGSRLGVLLRRTTTFTQIPFAGARLTPHRSTAAAETIAALPLHLRLAGGGELEVTVSRVERDQRYADPDDPSGFVRSETVADSDGARLAVHERWGGHRLVAGGEWRADRVTDGSSYGVTLAGRRQTTRSLFVQDSWSPARRLAVLAGVRWDAASPWGSELSPRVSVSWEGRVARSWVSFGRAFRAPGLGELYYPLSGNPNLAPERSRSAEAGVAAPLAAGRSVVQLVAFSNRQRDLIDFDYASFRYVNVARAREDGVEASWIAMVGAHGRATAALTWLDARDGAGAPLLRRPAWSGSLTLAAPVAAGVEGAASLVWVGRRTDLDPVTFARVPQAGFVTADLAVTVPLLAGVAVRARVENVADRRYEEVRGYPALGRRLLVGLETSLR
ncbi:MAG: TonB-dependent receptor [Thermoanaerobaculaceae bacterium]|nr:TonB-dependent receptor [Thermoanaerobaculaceae bacterium]